MTVEGTYDWVATYNGDDNNAPAASPCGSETVIVTRPILTGRAYGLTATATLAGVTLLNVAPTPDTGTSRRRRRPRRRPRAGRPFPGW